MRTTGFVALIFLAVMLVTPVVFAQETGIAEQVGTYLLLLIIVLSIAANFFAFRTVKSYGKREGDSSGNKRIVYVCGQSREFIRMIAVFAIR